MSNENRLSKMQKFTVVCTAVVVALIVVVAVSVNAVISSGVLLRSATAAQTANFKVDNAMFSYLFYTEYYGELEEYGSYYQTYYGFDESVSLKKQNYDEKTTWFSYFIQQTKSRLMDMLLFAEAAVQNGYTIDDEELEFIAQEIKNLETAAMVENMSVPKYIQKTYGKGVKQKDIENALKIILLANKQYEHLEKNMEITENQINEFFGEYKQAFTKCDIRKYVFTGENAEADSIRLAAAKSETEYKSILRDILKESGKYTDSQIDTQIDKTLTEGYEYQGLVEFDDWAFSDEAKAGNTKTVYMNGEYTVYVIVREAYAEEYRTKNVRHILISADAAGSMTKASAKAKAVLAEFEATDKSVESFKKLALEYNTDPGSLDNGGLYENVLKDVYEKAFEDWCFNEERKVGDYGIIKTGYGYHLMYYCGEGLLSWQAQAKTELITSNINDMYDTYATKYPVQFYDDVMLDIQ